MTVYFICFFLLTSLSSSCRHHNYLCSAFQYDLQQEGTMENVPAIKHFMASQCSAYHTTFSPHPVHLRSHDHTIETITKNNGKPGTAKKFPTCPATAL